MGNAKKDDGKSPQAVDSAIAKSTTQGQAKSVKTKTMETAKGTTTKGGSAAARPSAAKAEKPNEGSRPGIAKEKATSAGASAKGGTQTSTKAKKTHTSSVVSTNSKTIGSTTPKD